MPAGEYADKGVKSLDNRRVYEIYPGEKLEAIQDFEGRTIQPESASTSDPGSVTISGAPAHIILRWRFDGPRTAVVNGRMVIPVRGRDGASIEFDHADKTAVTWR